MLREISNRVHAKIDVIDPNDKKLIFGRNNKDNTKV